MATIPQITREQLLKSSVVGVPGVNPLPEAAGKAIGAGMEASAGAGFDVAMRLQSERNESEVNNAMVGHEITVMKASEDMKQTYAGHPEQYVPALMKFSADDLKQRSLNASNPFASIKMQQEPPFFVRGLVSNASQWAYKQGHDNVMTQSTQVINGLGEYAGNIGRDPHLMPEDMVKNSALLFDTLNKQAGSLAGSEHEEWADEIKNKGGLSIAKSMFDGAMETQPAKAFLLSQNPDFAKMFATPQEAKNLAEMQDRAYKAIGASVIKTQDDRLKQQIVTHTQAIQDTLDGKKGYSYWDAAQRADAFPELNKDFYNYAKNLSLGITTGPENNQATKDAFKGSIIDEGVKLGFKLNGMFPSLVAQNDFLAPKITTDLKSLFKFRDDLISGLDRGIITKGEYESYDKQLQAPLMKAVLKNNDPGWFAEQMHKSQLNDAQNAIKGGDTKGWFATTDLMKVDDFRSAYNVIERGLKSGLGSGPGLTEGTPEYQQRKVATYDAYFKALDRLDAAKPQQLNPFTQKPYTPVDVAHAVLGEAIGDVRMVKGQPCKIMGYDPKDGMPLIDTPKEWDAMLKSKNIKELR